MDNLFQVGIIEDQAEYRQNLKDFFNNQSEIFECNFAVQDVETFLKYYKANLHLDIILVDIHLPGMDGIKGVSHIRKLLGDVEIIMLTSLEDSSKIFQALVSGANGYLLKSLTFEEIEDQLSNTLKEGAAISTQIARKIVEYFQPKGMFQSKTNTSQLTQKENQVIQFIIQGKTNNEIAELMNLSIDGVKYHIKNIYKKLHVKSKVGLINWFFGK